MLPFLFSRQVPVESSVVNPQPASARAIDVRPASGISKVRKLMKNIYVGNLTFDATEDQVRGLFEAYGPVDKVSIVTDRDTGQPRGFAFVEMSDDDSARQGHGSAERHHSRRPQSDRERSSPEDRSAGGATAEVAAGAAAWWSRRRWWWPWPLGRRRRLRTLLALSLPEPAKFFAGAGDHWPRQSCL